MKNLFVFKWEPEYLSIHVDNMDRDHEKLIAMMNEIYLLHTKQAPRSQILKSLTDLGGFVVEHFRREEQYFDTVADYKDGDIHKAIHKKLVNQYLKHVEAYKNGADLNDDFFFFLKAWLVAHIEGVDAKYGINLHKNAA